MAEGHSRQRGAALRAGVRLTWLHGAAAVAALTGLGGCSRTGLEVWATYVQDPDGGEAGTTAAPPVPLAEPWTPEEPPDIPSSRWIAVTTEDATEAQQLFAVRLGLTEVEDLVRLDPPDEPHRVIQRTWSPDGTFLAFVLESSGSTLRQVHFADFHASSPILSELAYTGAHSYALWPWPTPGAVLITGMRDGRRRWLLYDVASATTETLTDPWPAMGAVNLSPDRVRLVAHTKTELWGAPIPELVLRWSHRPVRPGPLRILACDFLPHTDCPALRVRRGERRALGAG